MTTTPNQPDREREAIARIRRAVEKRGAGVEKDIKSAVRQGETLEIATASAREWATIGSLRFEDLETLLAALAFRDADRAGEGDWVLVPREPTAAMVEAGAVYIANGNDAFPDAWDAMLAAAPPPATPLLDDETVERN